MNESLRTRLKDELGLTDEEIGKLEDQKVLTEADMALLSQEEILSITSCALITAKKLVTAFKPAPTEVVAELNVEPQQASMDLLPSVPEDTSFLEMLKVGGVLKIGPVDVISAMRAAIASGVGLYDLPDLLLERMEAFAEEQDEPVGENFYTLQKMITSRNYADVLAILNVSGTFINQARRKAVLQRLDEKLWPALRGFNELLNGWSEAWQKGVSNPAMALTMLAMAQSGAKGVMPPGMMAPPDTAGLRDEAEAVINKINSVFAGVGIPVARALAYDAIRIKNILEEPSLPAAIGSATKDQMIKTLGISVGADYVRLERNVIRYALAIMELPNVSSGNEELGYLAAMLSLGMAIPWDKLQSVGVTSGRSRRSRREETEGRPEGAGFREEG